jgi:hypothetical protein
MISSPTKLDFPFIKVLCGAFFQESDKTARINLTYITLFKANSPPITLFLLTHKAQKKKLSKKKSAV